MFPHVITIRWAFMIVHCISVMATHGQIAEPCLHHLRNKALKAFNDQEPDRVIQYYDQFKRSGGRLGAIDLLKLARSHMDLGDSAGCIQALRLGIEKGLVWSENDNFLSIAHAFTDDQLAKLDPDHFGYVQHRQIHLDRLDTTLIRKVAELLDADQRVRIHRTGSDLEHAGRIMAQDSITRTELQMIFTKYNGFPSDTMIDHRTSFDLLLLIHHTYRSFPEHFNQLLDFILAGIDSFQVSPNEYAVMVDRRQYKIDGSVIYGEVPKRNDEGGLSVEHVKDPAKVDQLRYAAGLTSLKDHCTHRNCVLPAGYRELRSPCDQ